MRHVLMLLVLAAMGQGAATCVRAEVHDEIGALMKGQPTDVARHFDRLLTCQHFADEEAYDAARKREIDHGFKRYRCGLLDKDEAALRRKYRNNAPVLDRINAARRAFYGPPVSR